MKNCTECCARKGLPDFPNNKATQDGKGSICSQCMNIRSRVYKKANRGKISSYNKQWKSENADKVLSYREENKEHQARVVAAWAKANPEKRSLNQQRRAHRKRASGGDFSAQEWLDLCALYDNRCLSCKKKLPLTIDHVIPVSKGGTNDISNLQPLCRSCNSSKATKIIDFRYEITINKNQGGDYNFQGRL